MRFFLHPVELAGIISQLFPNKLHNMSQKSLFHIVISYIMQPDAKSTYGFSAGFDRVQIRFSVGSDPKPVQLFDSGSKFPLNSIICQTHISEQKL